MDVCHPLASFPSVGVTCLRRMHAILRKRAPLLYWSICFTQPLCNFLGGSHMSKKVFKIVGGEEHFGGKCTHLPIPSTCTALQTRCLLLKKGANINWAILSLHFINPFTLLMEDVHLGKFQKKCSDKALPQTTLTCAQGSIMFIFMYTFLCLIFIIIF